MNEKVTIFKNIFASDPHYITVEKALNRIKVGKSASKIKLIRTQLDTDRASELKKNLPSVCFSGEFKERKDDKIIQHSGYVCLDFDYVGEDYKQELKEHDNIFAAWVSPSGNGVKALVKIKDTSKHREHFKALQEEFDNLDESGVNESRVCFESYDPDIYINPSAKVWTKLKIEKTVKKENVITDDDKFNNVLKWLSNRGDAFVKGERNIFIFKLASACCRFGLDQSECERLCRFNYAIDTDFSEREISQTVKSAYSSNDFATAEFDNNDLVDTRTGEIIELKEEMYDLSVKPKDVVFGEDVKKELLDLYDNGYKQVKGIGVPELDEIWKLKRGDITGLTGIGNYGKSTFFKWYLLIRVLKYDEKFALFSPEDVSHEFYFDMLEMYFGQSLTPDNKKRPSREKVEEIHDKLSNNIFYVYPQELAPTPDYIKERFLELIIKQNIDGCIIDPFNQLANDYGRTGGRSDKYLETFLSDCSRFAQTNNIYFCIVMHPKQLVKPKGELNYPEPDVFDIADGAMWNNKLDNILSYHRPMKGEDPLSTMCTLSSKKIRRQKIVGKPGTVTFNHEWKTRRYIFEGHDPLGALLGGTQETIDDLPDVNIKFVNSYFDDVHRKNNDDDLDELPF